MKDKKDTEKIPHFAPLYGPFHDVGTFMADPLGSYTGTPIPPDEDPVQDADDL